ncbi:SPOR domain-containing protein [Sulfitobacter sp. S190]|uniref:SPOR domain-containing protein n=1 Tax=Sulfitobacter sp. S190 TaxID=2867022 RepID=UPI0021A58DBC|nr:SPOR domain-containing protein [Sulfitobacter sp. S190]UWR21293.1 SPOR domain-containing protein [Sulfitobacter sp. S190]
MSSASLIDVFRSGHRIRIIAGSALALGLLAGCEDGAGFRLPGLTPAQSADATATDTGPVIERDVEAPEIFSVTDDGLWDGRPSLGGVWVAHPDVTDPERVIIRNQTNGKFVVGALFRREREIPGPKLQISSDAAAALGILAGAPTKLNVTALKKVEEPATPAALPDTETAAGIDAAAPVTAAPLDPVAADASAAIDAAPLATPTPPAAPKPRPQASSLSKPFIQIGIFSIEANANRAAKQMRGAGLAPLVKQSQINGKTFWRVVVGPAANKSEQAKILSTIKSEGFTDAYAVSS